MFTPFRLNAFFCFWSRDFGRGTMTPSTGLYLPPMSIVQIWSNWSVHVQSYSQLIFPSNGIKRYFNGPLSNISFTNSCLAKTAYIQDHFVELTVECSHTEQFWKDFKKFRFALSGKHVKISWQDVLIGKLDVNCDQASLFFFSPRKKIKVRDWLNCFLVITVSAQILLFFKEMINMKYKTEKCIALIDQFRYIKIQSQTIDLRTRLWGINPTNSVFIP